MKRVLLFAILFATTTTGNTEPTPAVRHLMNEPVTLFDLGMLRLEQIFSNFKVADAKEAFVTVVYMWETNRISIHAFVTPNKAEFVQGPKIRCKALITELKTNLFVNPLTSKPVYRSSRLRELFSHVGFTSTDEPKNVAAELDTITELSVSIVSEPEASTTCKSALLSKEILFTE